jgi:hypothetical protein
MQSAAIDIDRKTARIFALTVMRCQARVPPIMVIYDPERENGVDLGELFQTRRFSIGKWGPEAWRRKGRIEWFQAIIPASVTPIPYQNMCGEIIKNQNNYTFNDCIPTNLL